MAIPLFSPDYLSSPTMGGVVPSQTADLMAQQGQMLAKQIEVKSLQAAAQAKAPAMATLYADSFTRIAQGDATGFGELERANSMAVGNPFLEAMSRDASQTASKMYGEYMQTQQMQQRFGHETELQNNRITAQQKMQDQVLVRQAQDDWRREVEKTEADNVELQNKHTQAQDTENQLAEAEGRAPRVIPPPKLKAPPKAPRTPMDLSGGDVNAENPLGDEGVIPASQFSAPGATGVPSPEEPITGQPQPPLPTNEPMPGTPSDGLIPGLPQAQAGPSAAIAAVNPQGPKKTGDGKVAIKFGGLEVEFPDPGPQAKAEVTRNFKTSTGSVSIKNKDSRKPEREFMDAITTVQGADPAFAAWATEQILKGNRISVRTEEKERIPYTVKKDGTEEAFGKRGPDQQPTGEKQPIEPKVVDAWDKASSLMVGELKGKIDLYVSKPPEVIQKTREVAKKAIIEKRMTIPEAQAQLKLMKGEFTEEELADIEAARRAVKATPIQ